MQEKNQYREGRLIWPLDYALSLGVSAFSFILLFVNYRFPPEKIFDEVYFARAAEEYLTRQYIYENTHPPVTKLLITLSTLLFGGVHGGDNSTGWRFLDLVFGAIAVWLLYVLAKRVTCSTLFAACAAALLALDGMHFVQSRIATPESFVLVFSLATLYTFYRYWSAAEEDPFKEEVGSYRRLSGLVLCALLAIAFVLMRFAHESLAAQIIVGLWALAGLYLLDRLLLQRSRAGGLLWLFLFGLSIALLVSSKWYGVMAYGVACVTVILRRRVFPVNIVLAAMLFVAGAVYFASYAPQFIGLSDTPGAPPRSYTVTDVVNMQYSAFEYHDHLTATHPYGSRWWQWPLDLRPILYYAKYGTSPSGRTAAMIYTLPNPLILWPGLFGVAFIGYLAWRERNHAYILIVLTYLAQWLPWMGSPRVSFAYHFYVDIPLVCLCNVIALQRLPVPRWAAPAYVAGVACAFAYFYPVLSGMTIPNAAWLQRMWLPSWI